MQYIFLTAFLLRTPLFNQTTSKTNFNLTKSNLISIEPLPLTSFSCIWKKPSFKSILISSNKKNRNLFLRSEVYLVHSILTPNLVYSNNFSFTDSKSYTSLIFSNWKYYNLLDLTSVFIQFFNYLSFILYNSYTLWRTLSYLLTIKPENFTKLPITPHTTYLINFTLRSVISENKYL